MNRTRDIVLSIALIAIAVAGYWFATRDSSHLRDQGSQSALEAVVREDLTEPPIMSAPKNSNGKESDPESRARDEVANCMTITQLESGPGLAEEYALFDSLVTSGPTIESYRGLPSAQLDDLAVQGDSAAMAVLGAISVMKAMRLAEDQAVGYLLLEGPNIQSFDFQQPLEAETAEHLKTASAWFYRAAVHGRLLALQNAGETIAMVEGSPTGLGWIEEDDYETLEEFEQQALDPTYVYGALAFEIAPELHSGPIGTTIAAQTPGGERQQLVLNKLAWQFTKDREAAGLPPLAIPESTAPSLEVLESLLCEP